MRTTDQLHGRAIFATLRDVNPRPLRPTPGISAIDRRDDWLVDMPPIHQLGVKTSVLRRAARSFVRSLPARGGGGQCAGEARPGARASAANIDLSAADAAGPVAGSRQFGERFSPHRPAAPVTPAVLKFAPRRRSALPTHNAPLRVKWPSAARPTVFLLRTARTASACVRRTPRPPRSPLLSDSADPSAFCPLRPTRRLGRDGDGEDRRLISPECCLCALQIARRIRVRFVRDCYFGRVNRGTCRRLGHCALCTLASKGKPSKTFTRFLCSKFGVVYDRWKDV